jgi:signal transduction histidine kinase
MRFHSIRWRLATTYMAFTLVVVGLVGLVTISLVRQQTRQQEQAYLTANAAVVAQQAQPFLSMPMMAGQLQALAETAAFLGNSRVQIRDNNHGLLADSGHPGLADEFVLLAPPVEVFAEASFPAAWMIVPDSPRFDGALVGRGPFLPALPSDNVLGVVQRGAGAWGGTFTLHVADMAQAATLAEPSRPAEASAPDQQRSAAVVEVPIGDRANPQGYVALSEAPNVGAATLTTTYRAFGIAAACAVVFAMMISLLVSRRITAPLAGLAVATRQMSGGDLSARAAIDSRDEVGLLAAQFNAMAARLQSSFAELAAERDTLRRFVADASHELRTPITALKTFNELLQSYTADDPAAHDEFLSESQLQLDRLESIVHHLLDLSRLDAQLVPLELAPHDGADLLALVARRFRPLAQSHGLRLALQHPEPAPTVRCDQAWLEMALSNLVDNAIKFSRPGRTVELGLSQSAGAISLWVQDEGSGIAPSDQPHIFERFYRGRAVHQPGSGLGLAIVQSVVQNHGGQIRLETQDGCGSRFTITLPAALPPGPERLRSLGAAEPA